MTCMCDEVRGLAPWIYRDKTPVEVPVPATLIRGIGCSLLEVLAADDYIAVLAGEAAVRAVEPDHVAPMQPSSRCHRPRAGRSGRFCQLFLRPNPESMKTR